MVAHAPSEIIAQYRAGLLTRGAMLRALSACEYAPRPSEPDGRILDVPESVDVLIRAHDAGLLTDVDYDTILRAVRDRASDRRSVIVDDGVAAVLGPFYDAAGLARRWGCTADDVARLRVERAVLGIPTDDGQVLYPVWQFVAGTDGVPVPIPGLKEVLAALYEWHDGDLGHALWLTTPSPRLGGLPAYQHLADHGHHLLVALARADAARGC